MLTKIGENIRVNATFFYSSNTCSSRGLECCASYEVANGREKKEDNCAQLLLYREYSKKEKRSIIHNYNNNFNLANGHSIHLLRLYWLQAIDD